MKKLIYSSCIGSLIVFLLGAIMKMMHMPGAGTLIAIGLGTFASVFLPLATREAYLNTEDKSQLWIYISGFICAFVCIIGAIFKIERFPGAELMLIIGTPLPFITFLPIYLYNNIKSKTQSNNSFLSIMFLMTFIAIFTAFLSIKA